MYASNKLSSGPQTEVVKVGATVRADNPTEEVISTEEDMMDGTVDVGADAAHAGDAEDRKNSTTPTDGGEAVEMTRVHD